MKKGNKINPNHIKLKFGNKKRGDETATSPFRFSDTTAAAFSLDFSADDIFVSDPYLTYIYEVDLYTSFTCEDLLSVGLYSETDYESLTVKNIY